MDKVKLDTSQLFPNLLLPDRNLSKLSELAKEHFNDHPLITEDIFSLIVEIKNQMAKSPNDSKIAKIFSLIIPPHIAENLYDFFYNLEFDKLVEIPESIRAYVTLRSCKDQKLNSKDILDRIERAGIDSQLFLYKFATCAAKRNVADFTNELTSFKISESLFTRRLAEIALYFDSNAFFDDLNEFGFHEHKIREEFYLRGLIRSVDVISNLLDDNDFMSGFEKEDKSGPKKEEKFSPEILSFFYRNFDFCKKAVQRAIDASKTKQANDEKTFISFIQASSRQVLQKRLGLQNTFFYYLEKKEEHGFLAMILLIKSIDSLKLSSYMQRSEFLDFLKEIFNFHDPATRFSLIQD